MAVSDTYYTRLRIREYATDMQTITHDYGEFVFFIPYYDAEQSPPSFGTIIANGVPTELLSSWAAFMPGFQFTSGIGYYGSFGSDPTYQLFLDNFPNVHGIAATITSGVYTIVENLLNGKTFRLYNSTGPSELYPTLTDALAGTNLITAYSGRKPFIDSLGLANSSGSNRGDFYGLVYTSMGSTQFGNLRLLRFTGLTSTTGATKITSVDTISSGNEDILKNFFSNSEPIPAPTPPSDDPYSEGGDSEPGGGDGNFDFTSTDIPIPGLPNIGAMSTGFLNLYHPSAAQLRSLASYMWSGSFDPDNFKKLFADPMDAILGLHIIPTISGHPAATPSSLYVGNVDTGLSMPAVTEQYYTLDCGTVQIPPKWGAYLDYSPYSKLSLYLPYIGIVPISADDCMRGSIRVIYHVDVLSGTCVTFVYCVSNRGADGHTLYTFTGSCNCECPVTEGQYANALMAGMRVVSGIVSGSAGGVAGMVAGGISEAANAAISMVKPDIGRSGGMGGSAGLMGIQYPYLILTVPRMAKPADQNKYIGYPSFVTLTMGDCTGFTRIEVTHLEGIPATQGELEEIVGLLAEGVIF